MPQISGFTPLPPQDGFGFTWTALQGASMYHLQVLSLDSLSADGKENYSVRIGELATTGPAIDFSKTDLLKEFKAKTQYKIAVWPDDLENDALETKFYTDDDMKIVLGDMPNKPAPGPKKDPEKVVVSITPLEEGFGFVWKAEPNTDWFSVSIDKVDAQGNSIGNLVPPSAVQQKSINPPFGKFEEATAYVIKITPLSNSERKPIGDPVPFTFYRYGGRVKVGRPPEDKPAPAPNGGNKPQPSDKPQPTSDKPQPAPDTANNPSQDLASRVAKLEKELAAQSGLITEAVAKEAQKLRGEFDNLRGTIASDVKKQLDDGFARIEKLIDAKCGKSDQAPANRNSSSGLPAWVLVVIILIVALLIGYSFWPSVRGAAAIKGTNAVDSATVQQAVKAALENASQESANQLRALEENLKRELTPAPQPMPAPVPEVDIETNGVHIRMAHAPTVIGNNNIGAGAIVMGNQTIVIGNTNVPASREHVVKRFEYPKFPDNNPPPQPAPSAQMGPPPQPYIIDGPYSYAYQNGSYGWGYYGTGAYGYGYYGPSVVIGVPTPFHMFHSMPMPFGFGGGHGRFESHGRYNSHGFSGGYSYHR